MKYAAIILLFVGLALAAPKQNPLLQADDCLHCVEDIVNAVAQCEVRIYCFSHRNSCRISEKIIHTVFPTGIFKEFFKNSDCLHCNEDIVNAVAECDVRSTLLFPSEFLKNS